MFYFGPPAGEERFKPPTMPVWVDFAEEIYGVPDFKGRPSSRRRARNRGSPGSVRGRAGQQPLLPLDRGAGTAGVVSGCGGGKYCPADPVTREQMAVFISATFGLRLYRP